MKARQGNQGFVLAAALSVSVLILLLGFAMSSMASASLKTSGNELARLQAKYAAESGVDFAMAELQGMQPEAARAYFAAPVQIDCPGDLDCTYKVAYTGSNESGDVYRIESVGSGPKSAEYEVVALVIKGAGGTQTNPWFTLGLVSEGTVEVNGWTTIEDGGLHGNAGYRIGTGRFSADTITASCPSDEIPASQCTCFAAGRNDYCNGREPAEVVDPVDVGDISAYLDDLWDKYDLAAPVAGTTVAGPVYINSQEELDAWAGKTVHVTGGDVYINVAGATIHDLDLVLDEGYSVEVNQPVAVENTRIWADDLTFLGHAEVRDSGFYLDGTLAFRGTSDSYDSVYVAESIDFHGTSTVDSTKLLSEGDFDDHGAVTYSGETTLATRGDVAFYGASDLSGLENEDGLAVIAEGDVTFSGRNDTVGIFWVGGDFRINGTKRIIGGVLSQSDIDLNGNTTIKAYGLQNDDLPQVDLLDGVYVLSRGAVTED
ncbi:hypothetical protein [Oceanithermus sp.]